jgi:hypothetical protein
MPDIHDDLQRGRDVIRAAPRNIAPYGAKWELIARLQQLPVRHPSLRWAVLAARSSVLRVSPENQGFAISRPIRL